MRFNRWSYERPDFATGVGFFFWGGGYGAMITCDDPLEATNFAGVFWGVVCLFI